MQLKIMFLPAIGLLSCALCAAVSQPVDLIASPSSVYWTTLTASPRAMTCAWPQIAVTATTSAIDAAEPLYMIVDLEKATGASDQVVYVSRADILSGAYGAYERTPTWIRGTAALDDCLIWTGVTNDVYKTTKLVLRRIKAGTFTMGGRSTDYPGASNSGLHPVTLTADFWIGVFEMTQRQWQIVMGTNPASTKADMRPVELVSYDMIRGTNLGANWPNDTETADRSDVDASSFMGVLRAKVPAVRFDLPTEAQWEYACRAGTETALNSGENLSDQVRCPNLDKLGRYASNQSDNAGGYSSRHTTVGSYASNAWGLYDMYGNVWEWCLDWHKGLGVAAVVDPLGATSGTVREVRGSGWGSSAAGCSSGFRSNKTPDGVVGNIGLRVAVSQ